MHAGPRVRALLVVDVQPTFCEGGELPIAGGNAVAEKVAGFVAKHHSAYALIVTTQDWHIDPGAHFSAEPDYVDTWPPHGLAGTAAAELHPALAALAADPAVVQIRKGQREAAYSGFEGAAPDGRGLAQILREAGISRIDLAGLALSHCVAATALDAIAAGCEVRVLHDLSAAVTPELGLEAVAAMKAAGVHVTSTEEGPYS